MRFVLTGKITPYVHRTRYGKRSKRAQIYHASQNAIRTQFKNQMQLAGMRAIPKETPLRIRIGITVPKSTGRRSDATNFQKAIEDAAQTLVFASKDNWVDDIHTTRQIGDDWLAIVDIEALS